MCWMSVPLCMVAQNECVLEFHMVAVVMQNIFIIFKFLRCFMDSVEYFYVVYEMFLDFERCVWCRLLVVVQVWSTWHASTNCGG